MGMTIDESIDWIKKAILDMRRTQICTLDRLSLEIAINTMRKYKKIVDIVEHWACCGNPSDSMIAISEVLEDEKIS